MGAKLDVPDKASEDAASHMGVEEIRRFTTNCFRPFAVQLSKGRSFDVLHPEFIAFSRMVVVVMGRDGLPKILNPLHIVSVNAKSARPKPKS